MPKFRKKPVVIDAVPWVPGTAVEGVLDRATPEMPADLAQMVETGLGDGRRFGAMQTRDGWHVVAEGDWIITSVMGERYPIKPDIFAATYEEVDHGDCTCPECWGPPR